MNSSKKNSPLKIMARMIKPVRPLAGFMAAAVVLGVLGFVCAAGITVGGGYAMLSVLGLSAHPLKRIFAAVLIMAALRAACRCSEQYLNHFIAFKLLALIRDKVFRALRRLCPAKLEGRDKGDLISVMTSDIELLEVFYAHTVSPVCIAAVMTVVSVIFIGRLNTVLGLIALLAYLCVGVGVPVLIFKISGNAAEEFRAQNGRLAAFVLDRLRGLDEVIQFGYGERTLYKFRRQAAGLAKRQQRLSADTGLNTAITGAAIMIFDTLMLFAGVALYLTNRLSFAQMSIALIALMSSFGPVTALANLGSVLQNTLAAGARVLAILDEEPVTEEITKGVDLGPESFGGDTAASLKNVDFGYGEERVLENFSLGIGRGSITGIKGKSGSGRSTVLKLIMRFWRVNAGEVEAAGENVENINTKSLRQNLSFVTQEPHLFKDTLAGNLKIAKPDAAREELEAACEKAALGEFIAGLPKGLDTPVGELGGTLSGGERQRIGLARAFLHQAPLTLLDEPTDNLDSLNEAVILKALAEENAANGTSAVIVSHRGSTLRICDTVIDIDK